MRGTRCRSASSPVSRRCNERERGGSDPAQARRAGGVDGRCRGCAAAERVRREQDPLAPGERGAGDLDSPRPVVLYGGFEETAAGVKLASVEKALFDLAYLSGGRSRLFTSLPESSCRVPSARRSSDAGSRAFPRRTSAPRPHGAWRHSSSAWRHLDESESNRVFSGYLR